MGLLQTYQQKKDLGRQSITNAARNQKTRDDLYERHQEQAKAQTNSQLFGAGTLAATEAGTAAIAEGLGATGAISTGAAATTATAAIPVIGWGVALAALFNLF